MARKGNRQLIGFICEFCKSRNYVSTKNSINTKDKLKFDKFCKQCRKITAHNESSKMD